ncbi:HpcH/HpaI aldolase/citrate lyase family protein [Hydrogenophaga intermedia]|uniref:HpcH/HpaI aldolase/citrate lyase family protein n=1 Tax=Hydrogenophaga intermedia TaxID=65786 RepID=UPI002042CDA5|nr:CoA ester lyase [Hydrogenophaga intermedia]MCM3562862.1 CoA ester lyase [Hydrogenophaga intermedia]
MSADACGRLPRAYLFVPADRPERYAKARASGADAVIIDLEDAVAPQGKCRARDTLANALDERTLLLVRINAAGTPWFDDDVELCRHPGVAAVMLPKADGIDAACTVVERCFKDVLPIIESARGVEEARNIARVPGVVRLAFGSVDLALDLGIECDPEGGEDELLHFRSHVVLASRLAGLAAPADGVSTAIGDLVRLRADAERARRLGFGAKLCIHPAQVASVQAAFTPGAERVAWARRVCAAFATAGGSAVAVDGQMIDKPLHERALAILRSAGEAA